jgi:hypothetical protein
MAVPRIYAAVTAAGCLLVGAIVNSLGLTIIGLCIACAVVASVAAEDARARKAAKPRKPRRWYAEPCSLCEGLGKDQHTLQPCTKCHGRGWIEGPPF